MSFKATGIRDMKKFAVLLLAWAFANVVAITTVNRYEQYALEREFNLRPGILNEFRELEIETSTSAATAPARYRLYEPQVAGLTAKYPVVLYLHGAGERGFDNARQLRSVPSWLTEPPCSTRYSCFVLVPQCPDKMNWQSFREASKSSKHESTDVIIKMLESVLKDPAADCDRVYLIGYSMGSFGTWELAAEYPDYFAAVVPISGGASPELSKRLSNVPLWALHGDCDTVCAVEQTREIVSALNDRGSGVRYTELAGVGHDAQDALLKNDAETLKWLFEQSRQRSSEKIAAE